MWRKFCDQPDRVLNSNFLNALFFHRLLSEKQKWPRAWRTLVCRVRVRVRVRVRARVCQPDQKPYGLRRSHVAAARKRSHQWWVSLTPNNSKTIGRIAYQCFLRPIRRGETWATPTVLALSRVPYENARFARREHVERPGEGYSLFQVTMTKMIEGFFWHWIFDFGNFWLAKFGK